MTKKRKTRSGKRPRKAVLAQMREENRKAADIVLGLTTAFCSKHLNEEYRELCDDMIAELLDMNFPLDSGKPAGWASGVVHAVGFVNFLQDPNQSPHMTSPQIAQGFGVSQQTMQTKSKIIRDELDLIQFDPDWCTSAILEHNPLVWTLKVNGFLMDIRMAPREAQEEAYRLGLIPYIPADKPEPKPLEKSDSSDRSEMKIIQFPTGQGMGSEAQSAREQNDDGPTLFDEIEQ